MNNKKDHKHYSSKSRCLWCKYITLFYVTLKVLDLDTTKCLFVNKSQLFNTNLCTSWLLSIRNLRLISSIHNLDWISIWWNNTNNSLNIKSCRDFTVINKMNNCLFLLIKGYLQDLNLARKSKDNTLRENLKEREKSNKRCIM